MTNNLEAAKDLVKQWRKASDDARSLMRDNPQHQALLKVYLDAQIARRTEFPQAEIYAEILENWEGNFLSIFDEFGDWDTKKSLERICDELIGLALQNLRVCHEFDQNSTHSALEARLVQLDIYNKVEYEKTAKMLYPVLKKIALRAAHRLCDRNYEDYAQEAVAVELSKLNADGRPDFRFGWKLDKGTKLETHLWRVLSRRIIDKIRADALRHQGKVGEDKLAYHAANVVSNTSIIRRRQLNSLLDILRNDAETMLLNQKVAIKVNVKKQADTTDDQAKYVIKQTKLTINHVNKFKQFIDFIVEDEGSSEEFRYAQFARAWGYDQDTAKNHLQATWAFLAEHPKGKQLYELLFPTARPETSFATLMADLE